MAFEGINLGWTNPGIGKTSSDTRYIDRRTRTRYSNPLSEMARYRAHHNKIELERLKNIYAGLDQRNPYLNMDLTMKNLPIDKKRAESERDTLQQSQVNILNALRGASGSSGAQSSAQDVLKKGMIQSQQISAYIGEQESKNRILSAQQSERVQELERKGSLIPTQFHSKKLALLLGMAQQEYAMHKQSELNYYSMRKKVEAQQKAAQAQANASLMSVFMSAASAAGGA